MRFLILAAALALAACSTSTPTSFGDGSHAGAWPFPVARGSAIAPPRTAAVSQTAPPEGRAAGGVDFGQWRTADAATYSTAFEAQITTREQGRDAAAVKTDLEANGFACDSGARLDCRIEIIDNQCPQDWYVVVDSGALHAGYEKTCAAGRS